MDERCFHPRLHPGMKVPPEWNSVDSVLRFCEAALYGQWAYGPILTGFDPLTSKFQIFIEVYTLKSETEIEVRLMYLL